MSKTEYLREYRRTHSAQMREYNRTYRARLRAYPAAHERQKRKRAALRKPWLDRNRQAWNILQRMHFRGRKIMLDDARELLAEYGPDYPLTRGLSPSQQRWLRRQKDRECGGKRRLGIARHWELVFEAWEVERGN